MNDIGFLIVAINEDQIEAAKLCASSVKLFNPNTPITLITTEQVVHLVKHNKIDNVVSFPYVDSDAVEFALWQAYWSTEYKYNIVLDCFSICHTNFESTWDYLIDHHTLAVSSKYYDFRKNKITNDSKLYLEENLPDVNTSLLYFEKDAELSVAFFKMLDVFSNNWEVVTNKLISSPSLVPKTFDKDLLVSLVVKHLGEADMIMPQYDDILSVMDISKMDVSIDSINIWRNDNRLLKLENYQFEGVLVYDTKLLDRHEIVLEDYNNVKLT